MAYQHPVGGHVVVAALDQRAIGLFTLPAGDGRAGAREHHALAAGEPGRFEHVAGADDVGVPQLFPRVAVAGLRREVDDGVPAFEGGSDRVEIGEVRTHRGGAGDVAPIEGGEPRTGFQTLAHGRPDQAAHAGDQDASVHGPFNLHDAGQSSNTAPTRFAPARWTAGSRSTRRNTSAEMPTGRDGRPGRGGQMP